MHATETARFRQMLTGYDCLAREQLICSSQVHVGVDDRDQAVAAGNRLSAHLGTLLALSASSPFCGERTNTKPGVRRG